MWTRILLVMFSASISMLVRAESRQLVFQKDNGGGRVTVVSRQAVEDGFQCAQVLVEVPTGKLFQRWEGADYLEGDNKRNVVTENPLAFIVRSDQVLTAKFVEAFTVEVKDPLTPGGKVNPLKLEVKAGMPSKRVRAMVDDGYKFIGWADKSGKIVCETNPLHLQSVEKNYTIRPVFEPEQQTSKGR